MRSAACLLASFLVAAPGLAQRHKLSSINTETPEGQLLQQIGQESEEAKKLSLLEQFATQYPKHEGAAWVYSQMQPLYMKANQFDKALEAGEKLLALDPADVYTAHQCLKAAEGKKDPDLIKAWSARTSEIARKVAASPKPKDEDEEEQWKADVDFAKQVDVYTEYSLYAGALATSDVNKKISLWEALEQRNPKYEHLPALRNHIFLNLVAAKDVERAVGMAEKAIQSGDNNEDMFLLAADYYMNKKDHEKTLALSTKLVDLMATKPKPEGMSDADWNKKKSGVLGRAHWMAGVTYALQNKFAQADKSLREALPLVEGNDQLKAGALFYLGLANFKLGDLKTPVKERILDALRFNQQCAAIKSPWQAQAQRNVTAIRSQYSIR